MKTVVDALDWTAVVLSLRIRMSLYQVLTEGLKVHDVVGWMRWMDLAKSLGLSILETGE